MVSRIIEVTRRGRKGEDGDPGPDNLKAVTTGGSSTVYTITNASPQLSYVDGYGVTIKAHATNGAAPTANVDTLGAQPIKKFSGGSVVAIAAGDMVINQFYVLHYSSDASAFILFGKDLALGAQMTPRTAPAHSEALFYYDQDVKSFVFFNDQVNSSLTVGREMWERVFNQSGALIPDGSVVYISGSQGNRPTIELANRTTEITSHLIGLATHDIADNAEGEVTIGGIVRGLDTSAFTEGNFVYLSDTPGEFTTVVGGAGEYDVKIGIVLNAHATQGQILVRPVRMALASETNSGLVVKATTAEAQGGTTGDKFMDDVLTKAAIDSQVDDAFIGAVLGGATFGEIGSYGGFIPTASISVSAGDTRAGSGLLWASISDGSGPADSSGSPSGTWRILGYIAGDNNFSVWQRIA